MVFSVFSAWFCFPSRPKPPISVNCPGTSSTTDREFTLTTDPVEATCLFFGNEANELNANLTTT